MPSVEGPVGGGACGPWSVVPSVRRSADRKCPLSAAASGPCHRRPSPPRPGTPAEYRPGTPTEYRPGTPAELCEAVGIRVWSNAFAELDGGRHRPCEGRAKDDRVDDLLYRTGR